MCKVIKTFLSPDEIDKAVVLRMIKDFIEFSRDTPGWGLQNTRTVSMVRW